MSYFRKLLLDLVPFGIKMTMVFIVGLIALLIGANIVFNTASNINPSSPKEMSVQGKATKKVTPDSAKITLGKNIRGGNITELQTKAAAAINALNKKLVEIGVKPEQIKTSNYNLTPVYNTDGDIRSYAINVAVELTLEKSNPQDEMIGKVIKAGTDNGIDEVRSLYFYLADREKMAKTLEEEAIADAKATAVKRADAVGANLGRVVRVDFGGAGYPIMYSMNEKAALTSDQSAGSNGAIQVNAGQIDLETNVTVVYELK